jgi:hypothetical protein
MRTAAQRIAKYNARVKSTLIDPSLVAVETLAATNYTAYCTDFYPKQVQLHQILNAAGVMPIQFGAYEAFHGQVYHAYNTLTGPSFDAVAALYVAQWAATSRLGAAAETTLQEIVDTIYNRVPEAE